MLSYNDFLNYITDIERDMDTMGRLYDHKSVCIEELCDRLHCIDVAIELLSIVMHDENGDIEYWLQQSHEERRAEGWPSYVDLYTKLATLAE